MPATFYSPVRLVERLAGRLVRLVTVRASHSMLALAAWLPAAAAILVAMAVILR